MRLFIVVFLAAMACNNKPTGPGPVPSPPVPVERPGVIVLPAMEQFSVPSGDGGNPSPLG